jgi:hypothetical protein
MFRPGLVRFPPTWDLHVLRIALVLFVAGGEHLRGPNELLALGGGELATRLDMAQLDTAFKGWILKLVKGCV